MKFQFSIKTISLFTLAFILGSIFFGFIHFIYSWSSDVYKEKEEFVKSVMVHDLNEMLRYPLAIQDKDAIIEITSRQLKHSEIHSIEVRDKDSNFVYREEKDAPGGMMNLEKTTMDIVDDRPALDETLGSAERVLVGKTIIHLYKEEFIEFIWKSVKDKILWIALLIVGSCLLLYFVYRWIGESARSVLESIKQINDGEIMVDKHLRIKDFDSLYQAIVNISNEVDSRRSDLMTALNDIESSRRVTEETLQQRDDFIKTLSHDIRTPVNIINSLLAMIDTSETNRVSFTGEEIEHIKVCKSSIVILNSMIEDIFNFERIDLETVSLNKDKVILSEFFDNFENLFKEKAALKRLPFSVVKDENSTDASVEWVETDRAMLSRIVENLIDNAIKFTNHGSVTVVWSVNDGMLSIMVKDTGIGIKADQLDFIFEKYVQVGNVTASQRNGGRGVGLYFVKSFVKALSGSIKVDSKEKKYTHFIVEIPYKEYGEFAVEMFSKPDGGETNNSTEKLKAFIIDDDEGNCYMLEKYLQKLNVEAVSFQVPELGYKALKKEMPDLIFIDYRMPRLTGDMLAKRIRENKEALAKGDTYTVCITAETSQEELNRIRGCFDQLMTKNELVGGEKLRQIVGAALSAKTMKSTFLPS